MHGLVEVPGALSDEDVINPPETKPDGPPARTGWTGCTRGLSAPPRGAKRTLEMNSAGALVRVGGLKARHAAPRGWIMMEP